MLRRLLDLADLVLRGSAILLATSTVAVLVAWIAWIVRMPPGGGTEWVAGFVLLGLLLVPQVVLGLFLLSLRELRALPQRILDLPADVRQRAVDIGDETVQPKIRPIRSIGLVGSVWRLTRLVLRSRDLLSPYTAVTAVFRPTLMLGALFATIAAAIEIVGALLLIAILIVS